MDEEKEKTDEPQQNKKRDEVYSNVVRAGKRTYFFDVKSTRRNEYYLTITESKKRFNRNGRYYFEKHKIFLYKEDFDKFMESLNNTVEYIKREQPELISDEEEKKETETIKDNYTTDVQFEDLDKETDNNVSDKTNDTPSGEESNEVEESINADEDKEEKK